MDDGERWRSASWIGVDWGTSRVRAWAVNEDGEVADRAVSARGMGTLARDEYEPALLGLVNSWLIRGRRIEIVACGMVGAREGWAEAGYVSAPCECTGAAPLVAAPAQDERIQVFIVPGVRQREPRDVMRGEETLIAGFVAQRPDFDGVICLPGHPREMGPDFGPTTARISLVHDRRTVPPALGTVGAARHRGCAGRGP